MKEKSFIEHEKDLKVAFNMLDLSGRYSKEELYRFQVSLNAIQMYACVTKQPELLQAAYNLAKQYKIEYGYAQKPNKYCLEEVQNTDNSVLTVINDLRKEV